jgi:tetratricopeptide (TPR) repeat protein
MWCLTLFFWGCQANQGIEKLQREVWQNPKNTRALFKLGAAYGGMEDYENASKTLEKLVRIDSTDALAYSALGAAYFNMEQYSKAMVAFQKTVELDSGVTDYYSDLANTYFQLKKYQKAVLSYHMILNLDPSLTDTYYNLGLCYGYLGDRAKATAALDKLAPENSYLASSLESKLENLFNMDKSSEN